MFNNAPFAEYLPEILNFNIVVSFDDDRPEIRPLDIISTNLEAMNIFKSLKIENFEVAKLELAQLESEFPRLKENEKENQLWESFKLGCLREHVPVISGTRLPSGFI